MHPIGCLNANLPRATGRMSNIFALCLLLIRSLVFIVEVSRVKSEEQCYFNMKALHSIETLYWHIVFETYMMSVNKIACVF